MTEDFSLSIKMLPITLSATHRSLAKRQLMKFNLGGHESNANIKGNENKVAFGGEMGANGQRTLLRKAGHEIGKILEGGVDIVISPAKWLAHMQENWYSCIF